MPRREALWAGDQRGEFLPFVSDPERSLSELEGSTSRKLTRRVKGDLEGFLQRVSCSFDVTQGAWEFLE